MVIIVLIESIKLITTHRRKMAQMLLLENTESSTTYADITNDGSMVIRKRYLGEAGRVISEDVIVLSLDAMKMLFKLLSYNVKLNE